MRIQLQRLFPFLVTCVMYGTAFLSSAHAQTQFADSFYVSVVEKTPAHPYYGIGFDSGYAVNDIEGDTLVLVRDSLYVFNVREAYRKLTMHVYTIPIGGTQGVYDDEIVEQKFITQGIWYVQPSDEDPDTVYYASSEEPWAGGVVVIVDSLPTSSVEEQRSVKAAESRAVPNPSAGMTQIVFTLDVAAVVRFEVFDQLGRRVYSRETVHMEAGDQSFDINAGELQPGLYHYRILATSKEEEKVMTGHLHVVR